MNPNDYASEQVQPRNCSPLRGPKSHSPLREQQLLPTITSLQLQEKIKSSCDKLASALGLPSSSNVAPLNLNANFMRPQSASFNDYNMLMQPVSHQNPNNQSMFDN